MAVRLQLILLILLLLLLLLQVKLEVVAVLLVVHAAQDGDGAVTTMKAEISKVQASIRHHLLVRGFAALGGLEEVEKVEQAEVEVEVRVEEEEGAAIPGQEVAGWRGAAAVVIAVSPPTTSPRSSALPLQLKRVQTVTMKLVSNADKAARDGTALTRRYASLFAFFKLLFALKTEPFFFFLPF